MVLLNGQLLKLKTTQKPLPRTDPCGWKYGECMQIFGGRIDFPHGRLQSQTNYLNEHEDITVQG